MLDSGHGIWQADGSISRSPAAVAQLGEHLERALGDRIASLAVCPQEWGKGGTLHFAGLWRATGTPVLVKLGAGAGELYWTEQIARVCPDLLPTVFALGERLEDLALGWTVMEQIPYGPLGPLWQGNEFGMTLEAGVRFQRAARAVPPGGTTHVTESVMRDWLGDGLRLRPPGPAEEVMARLPEDFAWVISVCGMEVCHHDLHLGNVVTRTPPPALSQGLLVDVAAVVQPWVFDAAYLQVLNCGDPQRLGTRRLIEEMAGLRAEHGLSTDTSEQLARVSAIVLAWFAIRLWGENPERHAIGTYADATRRYIEEGAAQPR